MNLVDSIKRVAVKNTLTGLSGLLLGLLVAVYKDLSQIVFPEIVTKLPKTLLLNLILALTLSCILLVAWIYILKRLKYKFGFYWNSAKTPHCPACKSAMHLVKSEKYPGLMELCCRQCNYQTLIHHIGVVNGDEVDTTLTLKEAQEML